MKNVLHIKSGLQGEHSYSIQLGDAIIKRLQETYPGIRIRTRDLVREGFPHLQTETVNAFFTPEESRTPEQNDAIRNSERAIRELFEADILVIGVPMYNFNIPSQLKAWIDHIARAGITFRYGEHGPEGLVKNKKVYLALATGGIYTEGPNQELDFIPAYLKAVLGFMGMTDIEIIRAEGTAMPTTKAVAVEKALKTVDI
ncbi:FMN-dependent NADH-azoreductase [Sinomicrobium weinanense]|uniref:FMN dependent NADH:quinone oxidoreductase n=1 Tax=Sinomicrobium weinanense TaxID=2842200 RepID=A0A926Q1M1_9FLAO|nr:FMN-dependent NADH-azoreductase [Sinomicrobium weinanense]MBC9794934.1 FMN-dependent NADH-azoreductase [Sinomicrobium weinanense]MBU3125705.1 FMN-dependent NADH-azoreductase [Sinomicrobium weinanense]